MTERSRQGSGFLVVVTDLFVSATATLLVVLALAKKQTPQSIPVQADLVAICPSKADGPFYMTTAALALKNGGPDSGRLVGRAKDLELLANLPGLFPAMLHIVALSGTISSPINAECLVRFRRDIVAAHNDELARTADQPGFRRIFSVVPISMPLRRPELR